MFRSRCNTVIFLDAQPVTRPIRESWTSVEPVAYGAHLRFVLDGVHRPGLLVCAPIPAARLRCVSSYRGGKASARPRQPGRPARIRVHSPASADGISPADSERERDGAARRGEEAGNREPMILFNRSNRPVAIGLGLQTRQCRQCHSRCATELLHSAERVLCRAGSNRFNSGRRRSRASLGHPTYW